MAKLSNNPNYWWRIRCQDDGIDITANLPEKLDIQASSNFESRFPYDLSSILSWLGGAGTIGANALQAFIGGTIQSQELSFQTWQGTEPMTFNFELLFDAEGSALEDVTKPMMNLQRLVLPILGSYGLLWPPGPSPVNPDQRRIELWLGNFAYIDSLLVISVQNTFDTRMAADGHPISGMSQVTLKTTKVPSRQDVLGWFFLDGSGNSINPGTTLSPQSSLLPGGSGTPSITSSTPVTPQTSTPQSQQPFPSSSGPVITANA